MNRREVENLTLDPMDMTMDVYEVNDLKELWETDLEVSDILYNLNYDASWKLNDDPWKDFERQTRELCR